MCGGAIHSWCLLMACSMCTGLGEIVASVQAVRVWVLSQFLCRSSPPHCGWGRFWTFQLSSPYLYRIWHRVWGGLLRAFVLFFGLPRALIPSSLVGLWPLRVAGRIGLASGTGSREVFQWPASLPDLPGPSVPRGGREAGIPTGRALPTQHINAGHSA